MLKIDLSQLSFGIMGLTPEFGNFLLQACAVCLEHVGHADGVTGKLTEAQDDDLIFNWSMIIDEQVKRNWADMQETTEYGATGIAILLAKDFSEHNCVERASKGGGFDYWIGAEDDFGIFQRKDKLEISGILVEQEGNSLQSRLKQKEKQILKDTSNGTRSHVCVTEFSSPKVGYKIIASM
jgi:hypothetical protein